MAGAKPSNGPSFLPYGSEEASRDDSADFSKLPAGGCITTAGKALALKAVNEDLHLRVFHAEFFWKSLITAFEMLDSRG